MGAIEDEYEDLEADVSLAEFRERVERKVEDMGGLADEETAAMLVAHELDDGGDVEGVADVEPGLEEVQFTAKVTSIGDLRTFERDGEDENGHVINVEVADETGAVRVAFWDERARAAAEELAVGDVLKIAGRPTDGYSGVEVNADEVEPAPDTEITVDTDEAYRIEDLSLGLSNVNVRGKVLDVDGKRTFDRDDGSEGAVANLTLGDPTGRVRVTCWDDMADRVGEIEPGESVEVVDGYVRERDGRLEVHCNDRSAIERIEESISYVPESTPIGELEIGTTADIAGVVRSADPKRTFDRDDGSEGQVRNVRLQDDSGDIRVALWGEKADREIAPGEEVAFADVRIEEGWQDDLEASANWQSTVTVLGDGESLPAGDAAPGTEGSDPAAGDDGGQSTGLSAFAGEDDTAGGSGNGENGTAGRDADAAGSTGGSTAAVAASTEPAEGERVEFTGTVVQAGQPVVLDDGERTLSVDTDEDVTLGEEVTVRGVVTDGRLDAEDVL